MVSNAKWTFFLHCAHGASLVGNLGLNSSARRDTKMNFSAMKTVYTVNLLNTA